MDGVAVALQPATPTPGVGPGELAEFWPGVVRTGWFLAGFAVTVALGWYVAEPLVSRAVRRRNHNNPTIEEALSRYVRLLVLVIGIFVGAAVAGAGRFLSDSALVVAAGTLAVGVAAQTVIGSLVSGLVLVADPEFNVGNYIEWEDGEGEVRSITLRVTRIRTPDDELVTVPNTTLTGQAITRPYGRGQSRAVELVGLGRAVDVDDALRRLESVAAGIDGVRSDPPPTAYVDGYERDEVVVRVHYWIADPYRRDANAVRSAYARAVVRRFPDAAVTVRPHSKRAREATERVDPAGID